MVTPGSPTGLFDLSIPGGPVEERALGEFDITADELTDLGVLIDNGEAPAPVAPPSTPVVVGDPETVPPVVPSRPTAPATSERTPAPAPAADLERRLQNLENMLAAERRTTQSLQERYGELTQDQRNRLHRLEQAQVAREQEEEKAKVEMMSDSEAREHFEKQAQDLKAQIERGGEPIDRSSPVVQQVLTEEFDGFTKGDIEAIADLAGVTIPAADWDMIRQDFLEHVPLGEIADVEAWKRERMVPAIKEYAGRLAATPAQPGPSGAVLGDGGRPAAGGNPPSVDYMEADITDLLEEAGVFGPNGVGR